MPATTDPNDPGIKTIRPDGQQENYLVMSEEERAKGFVRPVRTSYRHVGVRPLGRTRALTPEEQERYRPFGYVLFEEYEPDGSSVVGRFWTKAQLEGGCGAVTQMGQALAETYARDPAFYSGTFCATCRAHFPVGEKGEFVWEPDGSRVGT
jgi:hypothetical protein